MALPILRTVEVRREGPNRIRLQDLRELVETTLDFDDELEVKIDVWDGDAREPGYQRLEVSER